MIVNKVKPRTYLWILIYIYILLGLAYAFIVPVFEAPDEPDHLGYINYLTDNHRLPFKISYELGSRENDQPPLYYFIQSLFLFSIKCSRIASLPKPIPDFYSTERSSTNLFIHTTREPFSFNRDIIIFRLLRLISLMPGVLIIILTFRMAALLFPEDNSMGIYAAGINALTPQFIYTSATINNDIMAALFSSITVFCLLKFIKDAPRHYFNLFIIGIFAGFALLTKWTTLFLIPLCITVIFLKYKISFRAFLGSCVFVITVFIMSGWTFLRLNYIWPGAFYFHEPYKLNYSFAYWHLFHSFWGWFGWGAFLFPRGWRIFYSIITLFSALGILSVFIFKDIKAKYSKWQVKSMLICLTALTILILIITGVNFKRGQAQGRYLFPAISIIGVLITVGLAQMAEMIRGSLPFLIRINFTLKRLIPILFSVMFLSNLYILYLFATLYY